MDSFLKKVHVLHIGVILLVGFFGFFYVMDLRKVLLFSRQAVRIHQELSLEYTVEYSALSLILFVFTMTLGYFTSKETPLVGMTLLVVGVLFIISNLVMFNQPDTWNIHRVFPMHAIWFGIAIVLNLMIVFEWGKMMKEADWRDDLLDT
jgi:hypothetical protein